MQAKRTETVFLADFMRLTDEPQRAQSSQRRTDKIALCFAAGSTSQALPGNRAGFYARVQTGRPQRRAGLVRNHRCSIFQLRLLTAETQSSHRLGIYLVPALERHSTSSPRPPSWLGIDFLRVFAPRADSKMGRCASRR